MMLCWYYRLMISGTLDEDKEITGVVEKHVKGCGECRRFYEAAVKLGEGLCEEAVRGALGDIGHIKEQVLAALEAVPGEGAGMDKRIGALSAAAAVLMVLLLIIIIGGRQGRQVPEPGEKQERAAVEQGMFGVEELTGGEIRAGEISQSWPGVIEEPLNREIEGLIAEATSAVEFLMDCAAVNFPGQRADLERQ